MKPAPFLSLPYSIVAYIVCTHSRRRDWSSVSFIKKVALLDSKLHSGVYKLVRGEHFRRRSRVPISWSRVWSGAFFWIFFLSRFGWGHVHLKTLEEDFCRKDGAFCWPLWGNWKAANFSFFLNSRTHVMLIFNDRSVYWGPFLYTHQGHVSVSCDWRGYSFLHLPAAGACKARWNAGRVWSREPLEA